MKLNISSLAPDTFILGTEDYVAQFNPAKVFGIPGLEDGELNACNRTKGTPWAAEIHLTSNCQLACRRCSYGQRNQDKCELDGSIVHKILGSLKKLGVGSVLFSGGGEPLTWSKGFDLCLDKEANYHQSIATNGLALKSKLSAELLERVNIIQLNINGFDKSSYLQTTRTDMFSAFASNIEWLLKTRDKKLTQVTGKIVIDKENYQDVGNYLKFCHDMQLDVVVVKLAGNFEEGQDVELNDNQKEELHDLILSSSVINNYPTKLDAISTQENSVDLALPEKCWVVEYGFYVLIRANGDVFLCVTSPYTSDNKIGNIYEQDLAEMWNSERHVAIKFKLHCDMKACKCNLKICRHMRYNFILDNLLSLEKQRILASREKPKLL